jgi:hypothetical protein
MAERGREDRDERARASPCLKIQMRGLDMVGATWKGKGRRYRYSAPYIAMYNLKMVS